MTEWIDTPGALQSTGRPTDVALQGAGYFVVADATFLGLPPGRAGIERMAREAGVVGIPYGAFCHPERPAVGQWIRFAHCKSEGVIADAAQRLRSWGHPA